MWWLFEILSETDHDVLYAYSRENRQLDGRVSITKKTGDIRLVSPCAGDNGSAFAQQKALDKAYLMIRDGYPKHRMVACG